MSMITGVQVLSRTRFFILFFVLALTTFEWQVLVAKEYGQEKGGAMLGLASSFGTLLTVLILALLTAFRKPLAVTKVPLVLLFLNSLASWLVAANFGSAPWVAPFLFAVASLQASLALLSLSIEITSVQLNQELRYPRVRIFGSLGYLAAAFLSQAFPGYLFVVVCLFTGIMAFFPNLPKPPVLISHQESGHLVGRWQLVLLFSVVAFVLWGVARGFEVLGPIYLRSATSQGLMWLTVLIISESIILQIVDRFDPRWVIVTAAVLWGGVYALFSYGLSPWTVCGALMLAGFNCPAQVVLQSQMGKLFPGSPSSQAMLSISGAAGGFSAALLYTWLAVGTKWGVLPFSIMLSLVAVPILLFCVSRFPVPVKSQVPVS